MDNILSNFVGCWCSEASHRPLSTPLSEMILKIPEFLYIQPATANHLSALGGRRGKDKRKKEGKVGNKKVESSLICSFLKMGHNVGHIAGHT